MSAWRDVGVTPHPLQGAGVALSRPVLGVRAHPGVLCPFQPAFLVVVLLAERLMIRGVEHRAAEVQRDLVVDRVGEPVAACRPLAHAVSAQSCRSHLAPSSCAACCPLCALLVLPLLTWLCHGAAVYSGHTRAAYAVVSHHVPSSSLPVLSAWCCACMCYTMYQCPLWVVRARTALRIRPCRCPYCARSADSLMSTVDGVMVRSVP